ncbi:MAG TPA: proteasome subunit beta [Nitrososphaerales archaeon]|nr:proteasome subunit beta [Nitrososphaerales archaeon]
MAFNEAYIPGATVVGITYKDGLVLGAERRVTLGGFIVSKTAKKTFKVTDTVGAACAGMIGDMQILIKELQSYVKIRELELRRSLPANSIAKLLSVMMFERRFAPMITQVMIGGVSAKPSIWILDPLGSLIPDDYAAVGSGAEIAIGLVENGYSENLSEEDAKNLAVRAIRSAIKRDVSSGDGVDLLFVTRDGIREESTTFATPASS